jgi:hypothetical protein
VAADDDDDGDVDSEVEGVDDKEANAWDVCTRCCSSDRVTNLRSNPEPPPRIRECSDVLGVFALLESLVSNLSVFGLHLQDFIEGLVCLRTTPRRRLFQPCQCQLTA